MPHVSRPRRLALLTTLVVAVVACSNAPTPNAVRGALDPLAQQGFDCGSPSRDSSSSLLQWNCVKTDVNKAEWRVTVDGDDSGLRQIVAEGRSGNGSPLTGGDVDRLFGLVAAMPVGGQPNPQVPTWVAAHTASGGQERVGSTLVTLMPGNQTTRLTLLSTT